MVDLRDQPGGATAIAISSRVNVSFLMAVVFLVAADFALARYLGDHDEQFDAVVVTAPMANLLLLATPALRERRRPYWVGFQAVGWTATVLFGFLAWSHVWWFFWPLTELDRSVPTLNQAIEKLGEVGAGIVVFTIVICVFTTPLVLVSVVGGKLTDWWMARRVSLLNPSSPELVIRCPHPSSPIGE